MYGNLCGPFKYSRVYIFLQNFIIFEVTSRSFPSCVDDLLIILLFKNSITSKHYEIIIAPNFEAFDIRCWYDTHRVTAVPGIFSFDISDSSWDRKSSWEDSVGPYYHLDSWGVIRGRVWNIAFVLIDLSSVLFNSLCLSLILRFVIFWQKEDLFTTVYWHDSPTVTHVGDVTDVSYYKNDNRASSTSFNEIICPSPALLMSPF